VGNLLIAMNWSISILFQVNHEAFWLKTRAKLQPGTSSPGAKQYGEKLFLISVKHTVVQNFVINLHYIGNNDAPLAATPGPAIRQVKGWLPAGHKVVGFGEAMITLFKSNHYFVTFE
jgi:hypothetical protein